MRFTTLIPMLLAASVVQAQFGQNNNNQNQNQNNNDGQNQDDQNNNNDQNNNDAGNNVLALDPANVQDASNSDGQDAGAEDGQAASDTDPANFINFCTGKTLTNGLQIREGSCNGIVMGDIPAANRMVSAVFLDPQNGEDKAANTQMTFSVKIANLQAGSFTNPDVTYYSAPQALAGGQIVGHTHIVVQDLGGNDNPTEPLDAETFAFFKGVNDAGDGNGVLSADLPDGLPAGNYRACSMTSSSNHAPVIMPVAQRGPQDDCVRFTVGAGNNNGDQQAGQDQEQQAGQDQDQQAGQNQDQQTGQNQDQQAGQNQDQQAGQNQDQQAQQDQNQQDQQNQGAFRGRGRGRGRGRFNRPKFAARDWVA